MWIHLILIRLFSLKCCLTNQSTFHSLNQSHPLTLSLTNPHIYSLPSTHPLIHSINHIHSLPHSHPPSHSPPHIYSLTSTHPLTQHTHSLTQSHPLIHSRIVAKCDQTLVWATKFIPKACPENDGWDLSQRSIANMQTFGILVRGSVAQIHSLCDL